MISTYTERSVGRPPSVCHGRGQAVADAAIATAPSRRLPFAGIWPWPSECGRRGIVGTAYDTAWLAGVASSTDPRSSRFPSALHWLVRNQHADGSWGSHTRYEHDRILSTLAALGTLGRFDHGAGRTERIAAGTRYLWQHGHRLQTESIELVAFELLLPALIERATAAGIAVPPHLDIYGAKRREKLSLIPPGAIYSRATTLLHSLEFLGDTADPVRLRATLGINGSVGNSPSSTAYYLSLTGDEAAVRYLNACLDQTGGGSVPVLEPCENFELLWAAYHLYLAGIPAGRLLGRDARHSLRQAIERGGISLAPSFPIPDADDTAVGLLLLRAAGEVVDPAVLQSFERADGHFVSFPHERHASIGVNLHVLHALLAVPGYPRRATVIARLVDYLLTTQVDGLYWLDKWHISPYYATAHAICVAALLAPPEVARLAGPIERALTWLRETQNADSSWGYYDEPTAEETAYAVLALTAWDRSRGTTDHLTRCAAAAEYLRAGLEADAADGSALPALWIDKCLYRPILVVRAVLQAAILASRPGVVGGE